MRPGPCALRQGEKLAGADRLLNCLPENADIWGRVGAVELAPVLPVSLGEGVGSIGIDGVVVSGVGVSSPFASSMICITSQTAAAAAMTPRMENTMMLTRRARRSRAVRRAF